MKKTVYIIIIFVFVLFYIEIFCRVCDVNFGYTHTDERNTIYQYNDEIGWVGKPDIDTYYKNIHVVNNDFGFRDINHNYKEKNKKRIMFIGDSFCWGYGVNQDKIFVELLRNKLTEYELFNCGVSGYGTDQEYILLKKYYDIIKPDIVFLIFCCMNDNGENNTNFVFGGYYKPYYIIKNGELELQGVPVPKTWLYYKNNFFVKKSAFIRFLLKQFISYKNKKYSDYVFDNNKTKAIISNMKKYLDENNTEFIIGFTNEPNLLERYCKKNDIKSVLLENSDIIEKDIHWNEQGHQFVADKIYDFLKEKNKI